MPHNLAFRGTRSTSLSSHRVLNRPPRSSSLIGATFDRLVTVETTREDTLKLHQHFLSSGSRALHGAPGTSERRQDRRSKRSCVNSESTAFWGEGAEARRLGESGCWGSGAPTGQTSLVRSQKGKRGAARLCSPFPTPASVLCPSLHPSQPRTLWPWVSSEQLGRQAPET